MNGVNFWETPETHTPPSECSTFEMAGAVKLKGFKMETDNPPSPLHEQDSYDIDEVTYDDLYDEKAGKDLIMEMFLKSTRVFNGEESIVAVTEEESNLQFEESMIVRKKTSSVSTNVKSRRDLKKPCEFQSTEIQTILDTKETNHPEGDFTFVIDHGEANFIQKDQKQYKNGEILDSFDILSPPEEHQAHPTHKLFQPASFQDMAHACDMKHGHFQLPNIYCSLESTDQYCAPNFHSFGYQHENRNCMARKKQHFTASRAESVRFTNLGNGLESNLDTAQILSAPFTNYLGNANMAQKFSPAKNPSKRDNHCELACRYDDNHDLNCGSCTVSQSISQSKLISNLISSHLPENILPFSHISQSDSSRYSTRRLNYTNYEENIPNLSLGFGNNRGNNAIDLIETSKERFTLTRKESLKASKPDFLQESIPKFNWNFLSTQKDQEDDQFNTNFLNTHRDQSISQRDATEANLDFLYVKAPDSTFRIRTQTGDRENCKLTLNFQDTNDENKEIARFKQSKGSKGWVKMRTRKARNFQC